VHDGVPIPNVLPEESETLTCKPVACPSSRASVAVPLAATPLPDFDAVLTPRVTVNGWF
jgi:hypothetical protein